MTHRSRIQLHCSSLILLAMSTGAAVTTASAQTTTGQIYGTVSDTTGASLPAASVTITNVETNETITVKANGSGAFLFPVVNPGVYRVTAAMNAFTTTTQTDLRVAANQNVNAIFRLTPGTVNAEVTVEASAALIDTRESQLAETVDQKRIVDLPLTGRNAYDLVQLVPGITSYAAGAQTGDNGGTQFSTNGTRPNFNSFYLDGAYNTSFFRGGGNIVPAPDALSEFRIITSNFDAEFGRYPGAVVNTITRSGTNHFHGVAYDYLRNRILNARDYFTAPGVSPQFIYNIFGGGLGGPVLHDKLFFFASYQGTRIRQQTTLNPSALVVPSLLERAGNFSASTIKPNPTICPTSQCKVDPITARILTYVPLPDAASSSATSNRPATQQLPNPVSANQGTARLTYNMNGANNVSFTYFNSQGNGFNRTNGGNQLLSYSGNTTYAGQSNYVVADTTILSANAVNTATVFYSLNRTLAGNANSTGLLTNLGAAYRDGGSVQTQPQFTVTGYFTGGTGGSGPNNQSQLAYGLEDTFNLNRGNHQLKFGGSLNYNKYQETASFQSSSISTFNGSITGNAVADFITGRAQQFRQNSGSRHRLHAWDPSLFVQDNYHVSKRITANLGLRWEVYYPFSGEGNFGTFIPNVQSTRFPTAPRGLLAEGDPGVPAGILPVSYKKFAPRVGFAADVFGDGKTSLRGGYGIFYSFSQETFVGNLEQQPFTLAVTLNNTNNWVNPYLGQTAFPAGSPFPYIVNLQSPTFTTGATFSGIRPGTSAIPYLQQYNLTLERQYGSNWSSRMSYVGNAGRHFFVARDQNAPIYNAAAPASNTTANAPTRRPYASLGYTSAIGMLDPISNSSYNSLQLSVTRRFQHDLSVQAFYVWSKTIDNISTDPGSGTAYQLVNQFDIAPDRGLSSLHVPNRFVASFLYQLPAVQRYGLIGREVLSGWQINGIQTLSSGSPFNILSNRDTNLDLLTTADRPNLVGNPQLASGRAKADRIAAYFNTAAYAQLPAGQTYGTSPRNPLLGPGFARSDISAFKRFALFHESNLTYRAEVYNLFNRTNLNNPNGTLGNVNFGKITGADTPRLVQMALKLEF